MALSDKTKRDIGREDLPTRDDLSSALGVNTTVIKAAEFSKAEEELLQTNALTVEDNDPFFTMYEITQRNALIKPTYDPVLLQTLSHQNNALLQAVSAMEVNVDGTGFVIEPRNPTDPEETLEGEIDGETPDIPDAEASAKKEPIGGNKAADKSTEDSETEEEGDDEAEQRGFRTPPKDEDELIEQEKEKFMEKEKAKEEEEAKEARKKEMQDAEDEERRGIEDFFNEPWPGMSFMTIRRKLRRDIETTGNAYLEVIRDVQGNIVFLNYLDSKLVRMVRLGNPVEVEDEIERFGKKTTVRRLKRERRYAMLVGSKTTVSNVTKVMYFKEFGASRELNKWNGLWEGKDEDVADPNKQPGADAAGATMSNTPGWTNPEGPKAFLPGPEQGPNVPGLTGLVAQGQPADTGGEVPPNARATEIIHLTKLPDVHTLYGVPSWINQIPSVLGSRKAEELNLEFFNSGGLPPAMILIQGGSLSSQSRQALTGYLSGEAKHKQRGIIAEVFSTSGDLTSAGNVKVSVERFGAERQSDAMFMNYDQSCWNHVRMAFRLPPLFMGDSKEHNFATAEASYMVAEAQVFKPERDEFDEVVNNHIMKEVAPEWVYRSMPLSINNVEHQIKALTLVKDQVEQECFVDQVGEVANLELVCKEETEEELDVPMMIADRMGMLQGQPSAAQQGQMDENGNPVKPFNQIDVEGDENGQIAKIDDYVLEELAQDWAEWLKGDRDFEDSSVDAMQQMIEALAPAVRKMFNSYVAMRMSSGDLHDVEGTSDLLGCAAHDMATRAAKDDWNTGDLEATGGKLQPEQGGSKFKRKKPKS